MPASRPTLVPGTKYRILYQIPGQRVIRSAVLVFLEANGQESIFDGRPQMGTQRFRHAWLLGWIKVNDNVRCNTDCRASTMEREAILGTSE